MARTLSAQVKIESILFQYLLIKVTSHLQRPKKSFFLLFDKI